jgi:enoyl-CoA hydratase
LVGVLTGAGDKAFCAGGDLKAAGAGELPIDATPEAGVLGPSRWRDVYKPTIAAANGVAYVGASNGLA